MKYNIWLLLTSPTTLRIGRVVRNKSKHKNNIFDMKETQLAEETQ